MNIRYLKILGTILVLFFLSGCAIFVRDEDWHHHHYRGYWHHSSIQESEQPAVQMAAQYSGGSRSHEQVSR